MLCVVCCVLCVDLSILPSFPSLSLCPLVPNTCSPQVQNLRSFPSLVSIPSRSVTYSVCECVFECVSVCVCSFVCLSLCLCRVLSPLISPPQVQKFGLFFFSRINS